MDFLLGRGKARQRSPYLALKLRPKQEEFLFLKDTNAELIVELETHLVSKRSSSGKHKEDARKDNHLTDALLMLITIQDIFWYEVKKL